MSKHARLIESHGALEMCRRARATRPVDFWSTRVISGRWQSLFILRLLWCATDGGKKVRHNGAGDGYGFVRF